jgi:glycosyltransferase involved in cell wall biosynthesis
MNGKDIAIVLGTYNRLPCLQGLVNSVRLKAGTIDYDLIIVDGGSTDGSWEWLKEQPDVVPIPEEDGLQGAVHAFNMGFEVAVNRHYPYIVHLNDDAELMTNGMLVAARKIIDENPKVGEVAFEFDLRGGYSFDRFNGKIYANFGMIRREAGIEVAKRQGDPSGKKFWNPIYKTYGGDTEFGCWLWKLGWVVYPGEGLRVHDLNTQDDLRVRNNSGQLDSTKFWQRWAHDNLEPEN